jgi:RNA recognition motif-containing protein
VLPSCAALVYCLHVLPQRVLPPQLEAAAAEAAIKEMDQSEIQGRPIHVKVAEAMGTRPRDPRAARERRPRGDVFVRPGFMRLYVGNLSWRTTAADLGRHFQQFGAVQVCLPWHSGVHSYRIAGVLAAAASPASSNTVECCGVGIRHSDCLKLHQLGLDTQWCTRHCVV